MLVEDLDLPTVMMMPLQQLCRKEHINGWILYLWTLVRSVVIEELKEFGLLEIAEKDEEMKLYLKRFV